ncbi:WD40-repeat-containing domain protein [Dunaliella salina]|uniref:WD40-repeat-containing domain protein n=1 Tax=Dunaliella salina TaxID=3046 RepID=A0ABQ7GML7_DUNSA|nr:WD40-repeat-containing domain protein [Dunaliella salina]|eukprot:KAF5835856.1 WD40-repeat-containing domain protein [Dunaliella salina]
MDSDEDELREMRAARAARGAGPSLSMLKEKERRAQEDAQRNAEHFSDTPSRPGPSLAARGPQEQEDEDAPVVVDTAEVEDAEAEEREAANQQGQGEEVLSDDPDLRMDDELRAQFPMSFGSQEVKVVKPTEVFDKHKRKEPSFGPPRPSARPSQTDTGTGTSGVAGALPPRSSDAEDEDGAGPTEATEEEEEEDPYQLPISHEVTLGSSHSKAVTCLDIDHSGSRLLTGSLDYTIRIYDFNGMKSDMRAFRELEPQEGHPVLSVSWSPSGDQFMVVTGSPRAKIYDRNGLTLGEFMRGDMYIRDMKNTKGHVTGLTCGQWHPTDRNTAMTSSDDGTVRIWDTSTIEQKTVIKPSLTKPGRTPVTTCAYGAQGRLIGAALLDGSIQLWSVQGKFGTSAAVGNVPAPKQQMLGKQDGNSLLSRSVDSTMKLWDLRKFTQPVHSWDDLPCAYNNTKCIFSPDDQLILTGMSMGGKDEGGAVVFIDKRKQDIIRKVGVPGNATALGWHHRLNQIFVGLGNRRAGSCRALYSTTFSERGVMLGAARAPRKPSEFDFQPPLIIKNPHALPMYKEETQKKRRRVEHAEAAKARIPDVGTAAGVGKQGRIVPAGKTLLTQHLMKQRGELKDPRSIDPREKLLSHADKHDEFDRYLEAYKATQPKPIYAQEEEEENEDD